MSLCSPKSSGIKEHTSKFEIEQIVAQMGSEIEMGITETLEKLASSRDKTIPM